MRLIWMRIDRVAEAYKSLAMDSVGEHGKNHLSRIETTDDLMPEMPTSDHLDAACTSDAQDLMQVAATKKI
jgi:hypothetical protein